MENRAAIYQIIAENTTDLVCIHTLDSVIQYATPSSVAILGLEPADVIGKNISDFAAEEFLKEMDMSTSSRFFNINNSKIRFQVKDVYGRLKWLETSFGEIKTIEGGEYVLSSTRDITESAHLTDDLMQALNNEQEFSQFKSNLYSIASHEFKTPLAIIQANIEMLKIKRTEKLLNTALESMEEEVEHLVAMISDMLELKKLQGGRVSFRPSDFNICEMILEIIKNDCGKAYSEIKYDLNFVGEAQFINADYSLIRYSLNNVLVNAAKYSGESSVVKVDVIDWNDGVRVEVQDFGIGIPEDEQSKIFQAFYRAQNVSNISGTGIGLSIVKEFIDLHKGSISFTSNKDNGTKFVIYIPKIARS